MTNPAGRIHNTTIIKLDWRERIRALFGRNIRTDLRLDWELRDDRMVIVKEAADTYVSPLWLGRSLGASSEPVSVSRVLRAES